MRFGKLYTGNRSFYRYTAQDCDAGSSKIRQRSFGYASAFVADALRQRCHWGTVLDNLLSYNRDNPALQHSSSLEDVTEMEQTPEDVPEEFFDLGDPHEKAKQPRSQEYLPGTGEDVVCRHQQQQNTDHEFLLQHS